MNVQKISHLMEHLSTSTRVPIRYLLKDSHQAIIVKGNEPGDDPIQQDDTLLERLLRAARGAAGPVLENEDDRVLYGVFLDDEQNATVLGPVCSDALDEAYLKQYIQRHRVTGGFTMRQMRIRAFMSALLLAYSLFADRQAGYEDIQLANTPPVDDHQVNELDLRFVQQNATESGAEFTSYADELESFRAVREGDPDAIISRLPNSTLHTLARLADNEFKHYEYLTCSVITLAARAAIQGGLDQNSAYSLEMLGMHRLEKCKTIPELVALLKDTMVGFAVCVQSSKQQVTRLNYIEQAKTYVLNHLSTPFTLKEVAQSIGINPAYLSRRFTEEVGIGIKEFTQQRRMEAAGNMLLYSDTDISTIAGYLCYSSQSYFGRVFKSHFGVTPQKYRDRAGQYTDD